ncbi:phenylalanine--tRNA ligase subunit beta [Flavobacteriaceae bacterium]|nr:phenylalanine--tRNA ligase subunit beta [Flavobacteriaceae bacterium]
MKISYNWLKEFIATDWSVEKTSQLLTDLGLEVEGVAPFESIKGGLQGVVVGHVLSCEKHPNADKLQLTKVSIGNNTTLEIVCGAPNVTKGIKVAVATIGTTLYTPEGEAWIIKKGKIRGEESHGMLCSENELGLGQGHDGIMILEDHLKEGAACSSVFNVVRDEVIEIGLTPNRADAMSHFGVARDLKAGLKQQGISKELITPSVMQFSVDNRISTIQVQVDTPDLAPRYSGITISDLTVKESPDWIKNRLKAIGLSPINNVVDATNYVLHELGQPLHAFDLAKIEGKKVIVKTLEQGTKFTTLDGIERVLSSEDLMICDAKKPMCLAGVFGGQDSGVTAQTTAVFLESAYFNPVSIRKSAKRHGLSTDASFRFERGIDINLVEEALKRAALLIKELAGGQISSDIIDLYPKKEENYQVFLTFKRIYSLIGEEIPTGTIKSILSSLEIRVNNVTESGLGLTIPFYRVDVQREVDVIEEILRVYGYNNIHFSKKINASIAYTDPKADHIIQNKIGDSLAAQGFNEILTNSLTSPQPLQHTQDTELQQAVTILNPLSNDLSILKTSMLFTGLETVSYNINRKTNRLKLFEFGKTYHQIDGNRIENKHLSILMTGKRHTENWLSSDEKLSFFDLKTVVENILERLGIQKWKISEATADLFSEGISYSSRKDTIVTFGVLSNKLLKKLDIKQEVLFADFNWDAILKLLTKETIKFQDIPKYPEVSRDFALLIKNSVTFEQLAQTAKNTEKKYLKEVGLFDVYTGKNLPEGTKSYGVNFVLQDQNATLEEKQIDKIMQKLQAAFERDFEASLR